MPNWAFTTHSAKPILNGVSNCNVSLQSKLVMHAIPQKVKVSPILYSVHCTINSVLQGMLGIIQMRGGEMTKSEQIDTLMETLNKLLGKDPVIWRTIDGQNVSSIGSYTVDNSYGGYRIEEIINTGGGVTTPFGHDRYSAPKFVQFLNNIIAAIKIRGAK